MAHVVARKNENVESLLRRFKKAVDNEKILKEYKDRQYFVKPSTKRNEKNKSRKRILYIEKLKRQNTKIKD